MKSRERITAFLLSAPVPPSHLISLFFFLRSENKAWSPAVIEDGKTSPYSVSSEPDSQVPQLPFFPLAYRSTVHKTHSHFPYPTTVNDSMNKISFQTQLSGTLKARAHQADFRGLTTMPPDRYRCQWLCCLFNMAPNQAVEVCQY